MKKSRLKKLRSRTKKSRPMRIIDLGYKLKLINKRIEKQLNKI